jgi:hypothetical protein
MAVAAPGAAAGAPLPVVVLAAHVSPSYGGTTRRPAPATVDVAFSVNRESRSVVGRIDLFLPRHVRLSGRGLPRCRPARAIHRCPAGSAVGRASAHLVAGPNGPATTVPLRFYAGAHRTLTVLFRGRHQRVAVKARVRGAHGGFGPQVRLTLPGTLRVDAHGRSLQLIGFVGHLGGRHTTYAGLTGCPLDGEHVLGLRLAFAPNPAPPPLAASPVVQDAVECG